MRPERQAGSGRREFGRVILTSLAASARAELEYRRRQGQRLRARRALRRLEELEAALDRLERGVPALPAPWYARRSVLALVIVVWTASVAVLAVALVLHGASGVVVAAADVGMLVTTLAWFCIKVARRPPPPKEGSAVARESR